MRAPERRERTTISRVTNVASDLAILRCAAESARPVGSGRSHAALVQPAREIAPGVEPRLALGFEEKRVVDVSPVGIGMRDRRQRTSSAWGASAAIARGGRGR